jgi:hypothetical protein
VQCFCGFGFSTAMPGNFSGLYVELALKWFSSHLIS